MTKRFLLRDQVRALDRRAIEAFGIPGVVLMENAGRGATDVLIGVGVTGQVIICCGKGNNGGDGFVIARHLANRGVLVHVLLFCAAAELKGDAAINHHIVARMGLPLEVCAGADFDLGLVEQRLANAEWVVDALFGTGLSGPVRSPLDGVISAINRSSARVLAVDIPSGLDCDTGEPLGATVRAHHTVTFAAQKVGFSNPAAHACLGEIHIADIGITPEFLDRNPA